MLALKAWILQIISLISSLLQWMRSNINICVIDWLGQDPRIFYAEGVRIMVAIYDCYGFYFFLYELSFEIDLWSRDYLFRTSIEIGGVSRFGISDANTKSIYR